MRDSSVVEHGSHKPSVGGAIPSPATLEDTVIEHLKPLPGWEVFTVSSQGYIYRYNRRLKGCLDKDGYMCTNLNYGGKRRFIRIHTAVLETFVGPCPDGMQCRHLNGNPTDNRLDNLVWGTPSQNTGDKLLHGTIPRGVNAGGYTTRLTDDIVIKMRDDIREGKKTIKELAHAYGITCVYCRSVVNGRKWSHVAGAVKRNTNGKLKESV